MNTTVDMLLTRVRTYLRDTDGAYVLDDDIIDWLNDAQTDIAARSEILQHEVTGLTWDTMTGLSMPPGVNPAMVDILSLRFGDSDVEFVSDNTFNSWRDQANIPPRIIGRVFDDQIEIYPIPAPNITFKLRYASLPEPLEQGSDVVSLPRQYDRKLVEYATANGFYKDGEAQMGDRYFSRYEQGLPPINDGTRLKYPGPIGFIIEPGPFESDPGYMG